MKASCIAIGEERNRPLERKQRQEQLADVNVGQPETRCKVQTEQTKSDTALDLYPSSRAVWFMNLSQASATTVEAQIQYPDVLSYASKPLKSTYINKISRQLPSSFRLTAKPLKRHVRRHGPRSRLRSRLPPHRPHSLPCQLPLVSCRLHPIHLQPARRFRLRHQRCLHPRRPHRQFSS